MIKVATFGSWLTAQNRRSDGVGQLSQLWVKRNSPRVHSVTGIQRALEADGVLEGPMAGHLADAIGEYRKRRGDLQPVPQPSPAGEAASDPEFLVDQQLRAVVTLESLFEHQLAIWRLLCAIAQSAGVDPAVIRLASTGVDISGAEGASSDTSEPAAAGAAPGEPAEAAGGAGWDAMWSQADHAATEEA